MNVDTTQQRRSTLKKDGNCETKDNRAGELKKARGPIQWDTKEVMADWLRS